MTIRVEDPFGEHIKSLESSRTEGLREVCGLHGLDLDDSSDLERLESLEIHSSHCSCRTIYSDNNFLPFEARQLYILRRKVKPAIAFAFDGVNATIQLDRSFVMPNLATMIQVLAILSYRDSFSRIQMLSGDELSVAELLCGENGMVEEIEMDGSYWLYGKPAERRNVANYAIAGCDYSLIGGSNSPGADDDGWVALCKFNNRFFTYFSDPGEWHDAGEIARDAAIEMFAGEVEHLRNSPSDYTYEDWPVDDIGKRLNDNG